MSSRMPVSNKELHRTGRIAWLRAAVLGANDGILSTSSLVLGVAAAHSQPPFDKSDRLVILSKVRPRA